MSEICSTINILETHILFHLAYSSSFHFRKIFFCIISLNIFNKKYSVGFRKTYEYQPLLSLPNLKEKRNMTRR